MIKFIGNTSKNTYTSGKFNTFISWIESKTFFELDIETNVVEQLPLRKLKTIQFGNGDTQWVLQWNYLNQEQQIKLKNLLEDNSRIKYIHNSFFEYTVFKYMGITIGNLICTFLQEKILYTGLSQEKGFFSLKGLLKRYLNINVSKEEQLTFDTDYYTNSQIEYAAVDVQYLKIIDQIQRKALKKYDLLKVANLENMVVCAFGDIHVNGMILDQNAWRSNYNWAKDLAEKTEIILNSYLENSLKSEAINLGFYKDKGELNINWKSPKQRKYVLSLTHPTLEGITKPIIKKFADLNKDEALWEYLEGNYQPLEVWLLEDYEKELKENGFYLPPKSIIINWNSTVQRLQMFKTVEPQLKDTSKESLALTSHSLIKDYKKYINTEKLVTSYGENFIEKYVDIDGKIRTNFNQILNTGRVSSSSPNMQQIPAKEEVGNRYRNCFIPPKDFKFVSSDFNSQELVVIAYISQDPVWLKALRKEEDLHSICADMVFEQKWVNKADTGCQYFINKQKCSCKEHKKMRTLVKTINFGLTYGMSANKLSSTMQISKIEAKRLITKYFTVFPNIGKKLMQLGMFGMSKGYITTPPPFRRRRWFEHGSSEDYKILEHVNGNYNINLGIIERASKNQPIQGYP